MNPNDNSTNGDSCVTEATDSVLFLFEGPGDKTIRPRRPHIPLTTPEYVLPKPPPRKDSAEENGDSAAR
jgi:hypothetical protein